MKTNMYKVTDKDYDDVVGCEFCNEAFDAGRIVIKKWDVLYCDEQCIRLHVLQTEHDEPHDDAPALEPPWWVYK